jgi:uncharacterized protein
MTETQPRLLGLDFARALAVFGMVLVNFKIVMGADAAGTDWMAQFAGIFDGRASALFVILAGVGMSLMSKRALDNNDDEMLSRNRSSLLRRAMALFIIGLLYTPIWPADILHFYGIFIAAGALLLSAANKHLWQMIWLMVLIYPVMLHNLDYGREWDWTTLDYDGFWTFGGQLRHLFFNGFHPVIPWLAFLLLGMRIGRMDLHAPPKHKSLLLWGLAIALLTEFHSYFFVGVFTLSDEPVPEDIIQALFGTKPMPPMPFYMVAAASWAVAVIGACLALGRKFGSAIWFKPFVATGQLALTLYVAHVVIGMGVLEAIGQLENQTLAAALTSALVFCIAATVFSSLWLMKFKRGPLEVLLRKLSS